MQVRIAVLADFASMSIGNKLNIMGIFAVIHAANAPIVHQSMKLIFSIEMEPAETGLKALAIELVNEDGQEVFAINGQLRVEGAPDGQSTTVNHILDLNNLPFPDFGEYEFVVLLDNEVVCTIPVTVVRRSLPSPGN